MSLCSQFLPAFHQHFILNLFPSSSFKWHINKANLTEMVCPKAPWNKQCLSHCFFFSVSVFGHITQFPLKPLCMFGVRCFHCFIYLFSQLSFIVFSIYSVWKDVIALPCDFSFSLSIQRSCIFFCSFHHS